MSNNPLGLNRDQLSKALNGSFPVIRAFEQLQLDQAATPSTIEEAAAIANTAFALAAQAVDTLVQIVGALEQLEAAPATVAEALEDQYVPAPVTPILGTIAEQDAESVAITGGNVDGAAIGSAVAASGAFTSLSASLGFGCNGKPPQTTFALGAAATDLPTVIALANNIRLALIADGIAS